MTTEKPSNVTVGPEDYFKWCDRQAAGEVTIFQVDVIESGKYRLYLRWPQPAQSQLI